MKTPHVTDATIDTIANGTPVRIWAKGRTFTGELIQVSDGVAYIEGSVVGVSIQCIPVALITKVAVAR